MDNYLANFNCNEYPDNASSLSQPNLPEIYPNLPELSGLINEEELGMLEQICNQYPTAVEQQQMSNQNSQSEHEPNDTRSSLNQLSSEPIITEQNMQHFVSISAQNNSFTPNTSLEYSNCPSSTATDQNIFQNQCNLAQQIDFIFYTEIIPVKNTNYQISQFNYNSSTISNYNCQYQISELASMTPDYSYNSQSSNPSTRYPLLSSLLASHSEHAITNHQYTSVPSYSRSSASYNQQSSILTYPVSPIPCQQQSAIPSYSPSIVIPHNSSPQKSNDSLCQSISSSSNKTYEIITNSSEFLPSKKFKITFKFFSAQLRKIHFYSDNIVDLFNFKYACHILLLLTRTGTISKSEFNLSQAIRSIHLIISTVSSLNPANHPFYYVFRNVNPTALYSRFCLRAVLYFIFTSISYLYKNESATDIELLKSLISSAFQLAWKRGHFTPYRWLFLNNFFREYQINTSKFEFIDFKYYRFHYDYSIVNFIYTEMQHEQSCSMEDGFFTNTWKACQIDREFKETPIILSTFHYKLTIPSKNSRRPVSFDQAAHKVYQNSFIQLLYNKWNSIEELLTNYKQLKINFDTILVDFRVTIFDEKDFELLIEELEHLKLILFNYCHDKNDILYSFIIELEYFIIFKSLLFVHDLLNEPIPRENNSIFIESILAVEESLCQIRSFLSKYFPLEEISLSGVIPKIESFTFKALINELSLYLHSNGNILIQLDSLLYQLKVSSYLKYKATNLVELPRYKFKEFIAELEGIIAGNDEYAINQIFLAKKYQLFRGFWTFIPIEIYGATIENKKKYLEYFKTYLINNNQ